MRRIAFLLAAAALAAQTPALEVERAERAFAAMAGREGTKKAFLHFLADPSWALRPAPEDARKAYGQGPGDAGLLSWRPERVGVAASGDLAFSTGPFEYRADRDGKPVATGHFLSIWRKQRDGSWKVEVDAGVPHALPPDTTDVTVVSHALDGNEVEGQAGDAGEAGPTRVDLGARLQELARAESDLEQEAEQIGWRCLANRLAPEGVLYRPGRAPLEARRDRTEALEKDGLGASLSLAASGVSRDGDSGFTVGTMTLKGEAGSRSFLRIWRRGGKAWQVLIDLQLPIHKKAGA